MRSRLGRSGAAGVAVCLGVAAGTAQAFDFSDRPHLSFYGTPGHIDMPMATSMPDGQLSLTVSSFGGSTRGTLSFQLSPRIEGSFRYAGLMDVNVGSFIDYYDRSFDVSLRILDEGRYWPALKVGLQDFAGTGLYSSEYLVATKTLGDNLRVSAGLGWGRMGSYGAIGEPFGPRTSGAVGRGGAPNWDQWFRGPMAPFAGIEWQASERLKLVAEYSSDAYAAETGGGLNRNSTTAIITRRSPLNFGLSYRVGRRGSVGAYYNYGSEIGIKFALSFNPADPPAPAFHEAAPAAIFPRPDRQTSPEYWSSAWVDVPNAENKFIGDLKVRLEPAGLIVESLAVTETTAELRVRNTRYSFGAQAIGRAARAMTWTLPATIETFRIVPVTEVGLPAAAVVLSRSDIERFETAPDGAALLRAAAVLEDAGPEPDGAVRNAALFPRFRWGIGPYSRASYFDPEVPVRADVGLRATAEFEPTPGLVFSGVVSKRAFGNLSDTTRFGSSALPNVRTFAALYDKQGDPAIERLTANYFFSPGHNLYGRLSGGYLERMFGGVQAELLWKPVESRFALGADLAYVAQRDFDMLFDFQSYQVATGHVSAYYDLGAGYTGQVDVGRYLAGDVGATFTLAREFANGWKVGAFATFTDVSAAQFGEGAFDKGIVLEIPVSWFSGAPTRRKFETVLRPIQRDGGARLESEYRLFETVEDYHGEGLDDSWGRVWR